MDMLLMLGVIPIFLGFLVMRKKAMREEYRKLKQFHLHQVLDLDMNGLRLVTTAGTTRSAWDTYLKFAEDKKSFVLFRKQDDRSSPSPKPPHHPPGRRTAQPVESPLADPGIDGLISRGRGLAQCLSESNESLPYRALVEAAKAEEQRIRIRTSQSESIDGKNLNTLARRQLFRLP